MNRQQSLFELIPDNVKGLLPLLFIALLLVAIGAYAGTSVLPEWQNHDRLQSEVAASRQAATQKAEDAAFDPDLLQAQIERAQQDVSEAASIFLTDALVETLLDNVYVYAEESSVQIINLQSQQPQGTEETDAYQIRSFRLQVSGDMPRLMDFVIRLRETSVTTVVVNQLNMTPASNKTGSSIDLSVVLYLSRYATGTAFDNLPEFAMATPMMVTQADESLPTPTAVPTEAAGITATPPTGATAQPTVETAAVMTATPTVIPPTIEPQNIVGPGTYNDDNVAVEYTAGTWQEINDSRSGFGSNYHFSMDTNAELQFHFLGTDVALQYIAYSNFGIFEIYIDDTLWGEVDGYAAEGTFGQVVYITGLPNTVHTMIVRNTDRHNAASGGNVIAVDAIHVLTASQAPGN